jgi:hypothetical protein
MITMKKGQTVDFRSPKVPDYIRETKEAASELAKELSSPKEACAVREDTIDRNSDLKLPKKETKATRSSQIFWSVLWNKIRKGRNAIHQEG